MEMHWKMEHSIHACIVFYHFFSPPHLAVWGCFRSSPFSSSFDPSVPTRSHVRTPCQIRCQKQCQNSWLFDKMWGWLWWNIRLNVRSYLRLHVRQDVRSNARTNVWFDARGYIWQVEFQIWCQKACQIRRKERRQNVCQRRISEEMPTGMSGQLSEVSSPLMTRKMLAWSIFKKDIRCQDRGQTIWIVSQIRCQINCQVRCQKGMSGKCRTRCQRLLEGMPE